MTGRGRDSDEKLDQGRYRQTIGGQQSHESEYGEQGDQTADTSDAEIIRKEAFGGSNSEPGAGFILKRDAGPEEEGEASTEGGIG